ncbi:hypothetical protein CS542_06500 [Pedobacter sp. IW39]|nr:hypothetical protein CS542_06500 [Pedobacter sp. IW39]
MRKRVLVVVLSAVLLVISILYLPGWGVYPYFGREFCCRNPFIDWKFLRTIDMVNQASKILLNEFLK